MELVEIRDGRTGVFSDGSELQLDLIVFATGYDWLWESIRPTLGSAAARIDKAYGRAADGEYANTWRRSAQPGLWFGTGFIRMARYYSKFMALQIKAIEEGIEPVDPSKDPAWAARAGFAPHDRGGLGRGDARPRLRRPGTSAPIRADTPGRRQDGRSGGNQAGWRFSMNARMPSRGSGDSASAANMVG